MNYLNNKMELFKRNAVQQGCVPAAINCQSSDMEVLWSEYTLLLERLVCGEKWCTESLMPGDKNGV